MLNVQMKRLETLCCRAPALGGNIQMRFENGETAKPLGKNVHLGTLGCRECIAPHLQRV